MGDKPMDPEVAVLSAKMDTVLEEIRDLKKNYVPTAVYNTLVDRVVKLENNPWKFASLVIAGIAAALAYYK